MFFNLNSINRRIIKKINEFYKNNNIIFSINDINDIKSENKLINLKNIVLIN